MWSDDWLLQVFWKQKWWSTWYKCTIIAKQKSSSGKLVSCIVMTFYIQSYWAIPWKSLLSLSTEALEPLQDTDMIVLEISCQGSNLLTFASPVQSLNLSLHVRFFICIILWMLFSHQKYPFRDMTSSNIIGYFACNGIKKHDVFW